MVKKSPGNDPEETRMIGARVRELRQRRRWSQADLALHLGLSQPTLSQIERGQSSLSAEAFLRLLRLFNVGVEHFAVELGGASPIQSALARHGAAHLVDDGVLVPTTLDDPTEVIARVLLDPESPRHLTALAPVLVANIDRVALPSLAARLARQGREARLGWLLESILAALAGLDPWTGAAEQRNARRTEQAARLVLASNLLRPPADGSAFDLLDKDIRTTKTAENVLAEASNEARRWGMVTRLREQDFRDALRAARETR
jgi:putative transcriptional regulator